MLRTLILSIDACWWVFTIYWLFQIIKEYRKNRPTDGEFYRTLVSLKLRPHNWRFHMPYMMENINENIFIWVGSKMWGLDLKIDGKQYGSITVVPSWLLTSTWRGQLYKAAMKAAKSRDIEKYGFMWEMLGKKEKMGWLQ